MLHEELPSLPKTALRPDPAMPLFSQQLDLSHLARNDDLLAYCSGNKPYRAYDKQGNYIACGMTDEHGITDRIFTNEPTEFVLLLDDGEWQIEEYLESDANEPWQLSGAVDE